MATIYKSILINATPEHAWQAVRDFGAVHTRLLPGFVVSCELAADVRIVTFANGAVAREKLVGIDESAMRLCYTVVEGKAVHHNASVQVFALEKQQIRFVWITDVLPNDIATYIDGMMDQGIALIKKTLEAK